MRKVKKILSSKWIVTLVWVVGILILWESGAYVVAVQKRTPENVLPHFFQIIESIFSDKLVSNKMTATQIVLTSGKSTLLRAAFGFLLGTLLGFFFALLMKLSGLIEKTLFPYLMILQMIPILGMAPIVLAITGDIGKSRIIIAAILTFYPVAANTLAGLNAVEEEKYALMYVYAVKKSTIYYKVLIPNCIPYFFTGLKIAAPMAVTASILVDTLQGDGGLGCMLSQSLKHAMSIYVFWQIVLLSAVVGILSCSLIGVLERLISPHKRIFRKGKGGAV